MARRSDHSPEALRKLIVDAAEDIIAESGLEGLSARAVAARIGYSAGTIYNAFDNLDEVVFHVEARVLDRLAERLKEIEPSSSPVAHIHRLADTYLSFTLEQTHLWNLLFEHNLPAGERSPDWYRQRLTHLLELVEAAIRPVMPTHSEQNIQRAARTLWAGVHGISTLAGADKLAVISSDTAGCLVGDLTSNYVTGLITQTGQLRQLKMS